MSPCAGSRAGVTSTRAATSSGRSGTACRSAATTAARMSAKMSGVIGSAWLGSQRDRGVQPGRRQPGFSAGALHARRVIARRVRRCGPDAARAVTAGPGAPRGCAPRGDGCCGGSHMPSGIGGPPHLCAGIKQPGWLAPAGAARRPGHEPEASADVERVGQPPVLVHARSGRSCRRCSRATDQRRAGARRPPRPARASRPAAGSGRRAAGRTASSVTRRALVVMRLTRQWRYMRANRKSLIAWLASAIAGLKPPRAGRPGGSRRRLLGRARARRRRRLLDQVGRKAR